MKIVQIFSYTVDIPPSHSWGEILRVHKCVSIPYRTSVTYCSVLLRRGSWIVDRGSWISVDRGSWIVDRGSLIVDCWSWIVDRGFPWIVDWFPWSLGSIRIAFLVCIWSTIFHGNVKSTEDQLLISSECVLFLERDFFFVGKNKSMDKRSTVKFHGTTLIFGHQRFKKVLGAQNLSLLLRKWSSSLEGV